MNFFFNETGKLGPSVFINENGSADVVNLRIVDIRWKKSVAHANGKCLSFFNVTEGTTYLMSLIDLPRDLVLICRHPQMGIRQGTGWFSG